MTNKIIEAATACGVWVPMGNDKQKDVSALARFYAIARAEALEDAAKVCDVQIASNALSAIEKYRADFIADAIRYLKDKK